MTLSALIRKRDTGNLATATPAIAATQPKGEAATVARIATVAVANLNEEEERAVRAWLALIEETDPAIIAEVVDQCQRDADAREYFVGRATTEIPPKGGK